MEFKDGIGRVKKKKKSLIKVVIEINKTKKIKACLFHPLTKLRLHKTPMA